MHAVVETTIEQRYNVVIFIIKEPTFLLSFYCIHCSWSISHYSCGPHRTGVVGEWLQSCDGQTGTAGSGAVDDAAS